MALRLRLLVAVMACVPLAASANMGVGFLMNMFPATILMVIPAILLEAPILAVMLRIPMWRALGVSARANTYSLFAGLFLTIVIDGTLMLLSGGSGIPPGRGSTLGMMFPMFFLTWWLEKRSVRKSVPEATRPVLATFLANGASYAALCFALVATPLFHHLDRMAAPEHLQSEYRRLKGALEDVSRYRKEQGKFPATFEEVPQAHAGAMLRHTQFEPGGRAVTTIHQPSVPEIHGKRLVHLPIMDGDTVLGWSCHYEADLPKRFRYALESHKCALMLAPGSSPKTEPQAPP